MQHLEHKTKAGLSLVWVLYMGLPNKKNCCC